jgi:hypothetical protein
MVGPVEPLARHGPPNGDRAMPGLHLRPGRLAWHDPFLFHVMPARHGPLVGYKPALILSKPSSRSKCVSTRYTAPLHSPPHLTAVPLLCADDELPIPPPSCTKVPHRERERDIPEPRRTTEATPMPSSSPCGRITDASLLRPLSSPADTPVRSARAPHPSTAHQPPPSTTPPACRWQLPTAHPTSPSRAIHSEPLPSPMTKMRPHTSVMLLGPLPHRSLHRLAGINGQRRRCHLGAWLHCSFAQVGCQPVLLGPHWLGRAVLAQGNSTPYHHGNVVSDPFS